jgi:hypothetical protein
MLGDYIAKVKQARTLTIGFCPTNTRVIFSDQKTISDRQTPRDVLREMLTNWEVDPGSVLRAKKRNSDLK